MADVGGQKLGGHLDELRDEAGVIDHRVPLATAQRVELTSAITYEGFHACDATGGMLAAIEMGHLPTAPQRLFSQRRTEKSSATENQERLGLDVSGANMPGRGACHSPRS